MSDPAKREISQQPVCMKHLGLLRTNPYAIKDNLLLDDVATAVDEVNEFKQRRGADDRGLHVDPGSIATR